MNDFRLDRTLSINLMRTLGGWCGADNNLRVPILMYHGIREGFCERHPYFETNTSPLMFETHMRYLSEHGYRSIGLDEVKNETGTFNASRRNVAITFDDGYQDFYTHALPVLSRYGFRATVFIVSSFAQNPETGFLGNKCMNWREIREILVLGNDIGSHTVSHTDLHHVSEDRLVYEIAESKEIIEHETGTPIDSFAYPYAFPAQDRIFLLSLQSILSRHGYAKGVCTSIGTVKLDTRQFFMSRIPANTHDDLRLFEAKLSGAYDWVRTAQSFYKRFIKKRVEYERFPSTTLSK